MATTYEVTYKTGEKVFTTADPWVEITVEKDHYRLRDGRWLELMYRMAWQALTCDGKETSTFEDWVKTTADISSVVEPVDPTLPAPQPDDLFDSVSPPESASIS